MKTDKMENLGLPISSTDQHDVAELYEALRRGKAKLVSPEGEIQTLPDSLYRFLTKLLVILSESKCVTIIENNAKLTTVEAAGMLGVSRQFLVNLLEKGEIPYHMVGSHRRVYARDLLAYKTKRDSARRKAIRVLAKAEAEEGLYYLPVPNGD